MKLKKILMSTGIIGTMLMSGGMMAMAGNVTPDMGDDTKGTGSTDVHLIQEKTALDVTVPECIDITVRANQIDAESVSDFTITNNATAGVVSVDKISVTGENGYTIQEMSYDFAKADMDSKMLGLEMGGVDMKNEQTNLGNIDPTATMTKTMAAKSSASSVAVDTHASDTAVAKIVTEVSQN